MLRITQIVAIALLSLFTLTANAENTNNLLRDKNDPVAGNPNGKVTIVEFFDYQCSHCVSMTPVLTAIIKANPDVRVIYKEFPIRGDVSELASRAAIAAQMQGKYLAFHHALMDNAATLNKDEIYKLAQQQGLNVEKLKQDMNSKAVTDQIKETYDLAEKLGINVTPVFMVGKTNATESKQMNTILGEVTQTELQKAIDKAKK